MLLVWTDDRTVYVENPPECTENFLETKSEVSGVVAYRTI